MFSFFPMGATKPNAMHISVGHPGHMSRQKSCQILSQMMQNKTKITTACFSSLPLPHVHQVLHNKRVNFHSSPHLGSILHCTVASLQPTTALCFVLAMEESSISTAKSILLIFTKEQIAITRWPRQHKHMP